MSSDSPAPSSDAEGFESVADVAVFIDIDMDIDIDIDIDVGFGITTTDGSCDDSTVASTTGNKEHIVWRDSACSRPSTLLSS